MIETIQLVNCQSWQNGSFTLSRDKINVIIAKNDTGKSVLMKMLKVSVSPKFFPPKKRKKLIRWGKPDARAYYRFTDGALAVVIVQQNAKVIYGFKEPDADKLTMTIEPPARLVEELGMMVNSDGTFIANIIDTDQNLMLVDSDSKATCEFISMMCNNATLDEYKETLQVWQKSTLESLEKVELQQTSLQYQLQQLKYVDIAKEGERLHKLQIAKDMLAKLIDGARILNKLEYRDGVIDFNKLLTIADVVIKMENNSLNDLKIGIFNEHSIDAVESLERLESIKFSKLMVNTRPVAEEKIAGLQLLEKLERVILRDVYVGEPPIGHAPLNVLEMLEDTRDKLTELKRIVVSSEQLSSEIQELKEEFNKSGDLYSCPIYGEVVYNGEECIHDRY